MTAPAEEENQPAVDLSINPESPRSDAREEGESQGSPPSPGPEWKLNQKMKLEVRSLVEALERCLKTQTDYESVGKLNDKLRKQISELKTSDDQRDKVIALTDAIKEKSRETAALRSEHEALKRINREQRRWKQEEHVLSQEDSTRLIELQQTAVELKTTIVELKEKKQKVEGALKEKEAQAENLEQKYKGLMALVTKSETNGSKIESLGPLPRGSEVEYLQKHLATLQQCKENDEKNHAALIQNAMNQLKDNKNKVIQLQDLLLQKEEEIKKNTALLRSLKTHSRIAVLPPIPDVLEKERKRKQKPIQSPCFKPKEVHANLKKVPKDSSDKKYQQNSTIDSDDPSINPGSKDGKGNRSKGHGGHKHSGKSPRGKGNGQQRSPRDNHAQKGGNDSSVERSQRPKPPTSPRGNNNPRHNRSQGSNKSNQSGQSGDEKKIAQNVAQQYVQKTITSAAINALYTRKFQ